MAVEGKPLETEQERAAPRRFAPTPGLLDAVLAQTTSMEQRDGILSRFLNEPDPWVALAGWLHHARQPDRPLTRREVIRLLHRDIARLDAVLNQQVNAILHHPVFQKLEASWRGVRYLTAQLTEGENVKIKLLSISWRELTRDFDRALEFDQSFLFRIVYSEEFGMPGGEPYSVLLADYEIRHRPAPDHPYDDLAALRSISEVAAAAFTPLIAAAHPTMLGLDSFTEMERQRNITRFFEQPEYLKWRVLRNTEDARFIGLTIPRVLMRLPYRDTPSRVDGFRFREEVGNPDRSEYLWGTAIYAFGGVLIRAFMSSGWLAGIRGVQRGILSGGLVTGLPSHTFRTERKEVAPHPPTDVIITDAQEKELGELGFIPLCYCQDTDLAAFYGNQSIQKPPVFDEQVATINARLSAMLQYILCVSRFAHYVKVISRDKVGAFKGPGECEDYLRRWLLNYIISNDNAGPEMKVRYPLREGRVDVRERPDKPGSYICVMRLRPHYQLDQMVSSVKLVTELAGGPPA